MKSGSVADYRPRWWLIVVLVAVLAVTVGLFLRHQSRQPVEQPAPVERSRNDLVLRDGVYLDDGRPFSGIIFETYAGGETKSRSMVSNGLLEGLSEGWFTNGVLQVAEYFSKGVSHGARTKYHPNGNKLSAANVVSGQIQGLYQRWHDNGMLAEKVHLTNGVPDGESLAFHPDGSLKARVRLRQGKIVEQKFWEPGEVRE